MLSVSRDFHDRMRTSNREIENWIESADDIDEDDKNSNADDQDNT